MWIKLKINLSKINTTYKTSSATIMIKQEIILIITIVQWTNTPTNNRIHIIATTTSDSRSKNRSSQPIIITITIRMECTIKIWMIIIRDTNMGTTGKLCSWISIRWTSSIIIIKIIQRIILRWWIEARLWNIQETMDIINRTIHPILKMKENIKMSLIWKLKGKEPFKPRWIKLINWKARGCLVNNLNA